MHAAVGKLHCPQKWGTNFYIAVQMGRWTADHCKSPRSWGMNTKTQSNLQGMPTRLIYMVGREGWIFLYDQEEMEPYIRLVLMGSMHGAAYAQLWSTETEGVLPPPHTHTSDWIEGVQDWGYRQRNKEWNVWDKVNKQRGDVMAKWERQVTVIM